MVYVITEPCMESKDGSCVAVCPVDCIDSTPEADQFFINPQECVSCGACVDVCPVDAIYHRDDVPAEMARSIEANAAFFVEATSDHAAT
jgi:NAD-dependent dihydropyrimidine dehydrogenase PreA subunit